MPEADVTNIMPDVTKMDTRILQSYTALAFNSRNSALSSLKRTNFYRIVETSAVVFTAILAITFVKSHNSVFSRLIPPFSARFNWLLIPAVLVAAAIIPTIIKKQKLSRIGFNLTQTALSIKIVCSISLIAFALVFLGRLVLKWYGYNMLMLESALIQTNWLSFIFYQFMYIAVAEEVFFRGYVQSNIQQLIGSISFQRTYKCKWLIIFLSAGVFALAHIVIKGQIIAGLTLLPGLVLAWLFYRTHSLLAPILFHGLANIYWSLLFAVPV